MASRYAVLPCGIPGQTIRHTSGETITSRDIWDLLTEKVTLLESIRQCRPYLEDPESQISFFDNAIVETAGFGNRAEGYKDALETRNALIRRHVFTSDGRPVGDFKTAVAVLRSDNKVEPMSRNLDAPTPINEFYGNMWPPAIISLPGSRKITSLGGF